MKEFRAKLIERIKRTPTIESFRFRCSEKINFFPGQFVQVIFNETDPADNDSNKYLSLSASPTKDYFEVTKRLSESYFSQKLKNLKTGDEILFKGPMGNCIFSESDKKIVFLIGGIGITPVISILEYIVEKNLDNDVILIYSNKSEEEIAFWEELDDLKKTGQNLNIFYLVTDVSPKRSVCLYTRINQDFLAAKIPDFRGRVFFIFGPPKMVDDLRDMVLEIGCPEENIYLEKFVGY